MENNSVNRPIVSCSKGSSTDKSNNGQESKQFSSSSSKSVVSAPPSTATGSTPAPVSSKSKSLSNAYEKNDKRSSGRGNYGSNSKHSERGSAVARPEIGSVSRPGSKKGNVVCDFVNFSYDGRGAGREYHGGRYSSSRAENYSRFQNLGSRNRHVSASYGPSYNKEQYLQATCQFVVMEGFNYSAHLADADLIVDWDHIEELRMTLDEIPSCPICLYPPVAAKITRCGHVFCWPCILHYLALSDKAWRKCPICYESIYKNQLKSVVTSKVPHLQIGNETKLILMRREKGSNVILPAAETAIRQQIKHIDGSNTQFSKLLAITRGQVVEHIVERERVELQVKLAEDEHEPEACFIREALESLQERERQLKTDTPKSEKHEKSPISGSPPSGNLHSPFSHRGGDVAHFTDAFNDEKRSGGSCSVRSAQSAPAAVSSSSRLSTGNNINTDDGFPEESDELTHGMETMAAAAAAATLNDKAYYFYQAQDGQQVYLHPVNARCMIHQYGTLATAPETITGEIVDIETYVMTEDLRRRFRYLAHLPLTTIFMLAELKLSQEILSETTMSHFAADYAKRQEARQRKAREEKRQQVQAERWERAVMMDPRNASKYVRSNNDFPDIPVVTYVPSAQRDIEAGINNSAAAPADSNSEPNAAAVISASSPPPSSPAERTTAPSFAQMLRQGKPKPAPVQPQQTPSRTAASGPANNDLAEFDEEQREFLHSHSFQDAFSDALQSALDNYRNTTAAATNVNGDVEEATVATKKKKKKTKGRLLFST